MSLAKTICVMLAMSAVACSSAQPRDLASDCPATKQVERENMERLDRLELALRRRQLRETQDDLEAALNGSPRPRPAVVEIPDPDHIPADAGVIWCAWGPCLVRIDYCVEYPDTCLLRRNHVFVYRDAVTGDELSWHQENEKEAASRDEAIRIVQRTIDFWMPQLRDKLVAERCRSVAQASAEASDIFRTQIARSLDTDPRRKWQLRIEDFRFAAP